VLSSSTGVVLSHHTTKDELALGCLLGDVKPRGLITCLGLDLPYLVTKLPYGGDILPPAPAYELWLTGKGAKLPNRNHPVPSSRLGWRRLLTTLPGVQHPRDW
jgi:hypothetical protein